MFGNYYASYRETWYMFSLLVVGGIVVAAMYSHVMQYLLTNYMYADSTRLL